MKIASLRAASIVIGLGLAASLPAMDIGADLQQKIQALFNEANDHYRKKDHRKSIEMIKKVLELVPPDGDYDPLRMKGHYFIAANYCLLKEEAEALVHIEKAIDNGMTEMAYLERNVDFASLRAAKGYSSLAEKMRKRTEIERRRKLEKLKAFDFSLTSFDGKPLRKKDFLGQVLIVDIWGTWCPPCRMEIPHFIELHKRHHEKGLRIVGLNSEKTDDRREAERRTKKFIEDSKIPYPCALVTDEVLKSIPGFSAFPTTIVIGRDGVPRTMEVGAREYEALEAIVKPLLAEEAPPGAAPGKSAPAPAAPGAGTTPK